MNRPKKTPVRSSKLDAFHFYSAALKPVGLTYCEADQQEIAQNSVVIDELSTIYVHGSTT